MPEKKLLIARRSRRSSLQVVKMRFIQILPVLLLAQFISAASLESPWKWNTCGLVEPPQGHSVREYATGTVRLDSNGVLQCSCRKANTFEKVKFSVVDNEGRVAQVSATVYPCLSAACSGQVVSITTALEISNFTVVELLPKECNEVIEVYKTSNTVMFVAQEFNELHGTYCRSLPTIVLSQSHTYMLPEAATHVNVTSRSSTVALSIMFQVPFDMDGCAEALKQGGHPSVVLHNSIKMYHLTQKRHVIKKRDNNQPMFLRNYYSVEVVENTALGTTVTVAQASDADQGISGELTYTMQPVSNHISADFFEIRNSSGVITTTDTIDREMMSSHFFYVTATDGGGLYHTVHYTITVTDENDNSPRFIMGDYYTVILQENHQEHSSVLSFVVADDDEGTNSQISFSLENNTGNVFTINVASGEPTLNIVQQLDYETLSFYRLTIVARDGGTPSHSAMATVDVEVRDVLDNPPVFSSTEYTLDVLENTEVGTPIFTLNATTLDSPSIAEISYYILLSSADFRFTVVTTTGVLTVHDDIDYEERQLYTLTVRAQTSPALQSIVSVVINIINLNDNAPHFIRSVYNGDIVEGTQSPHIVLTVRATDDDRGIYGVINYHIAGNDSNITSNFHLNTATGDIGTLTVLDYEMQRMYSFVVVAEDGGNPPRSDHVSVTIQVGNKNDESPVFISLTYNTTITENSGAGVLVAQVEADDADSSSLEYYIIPAGLQSKFSIEIASGRITTRESLDREDGTFYTLEVSASDGQLQSDANALVYVTVEDVNDRPPLFMPSRYSVELSELQTVNSTVAVVEACDEDEGTNSEVTYTSEGIPHAFLLDSESGIITLAEPLDFEDEHYFGFLVWAHDGGDVPLSSSALVEITVKDENDNTPVFDPGPRSSSVLENSDTFTSVLHLSAKDRDSGSNADLEFSIIADNHAMQAFSIDSSGVIETRHPLDREELPLYNLVVEVRDRGAVPLSSTTIVDIEIEDEIDFPPSFDSISYNREIVADTPASTPLVTVTATTQDDVPQSSILYSLASGANRTLFYLDQWTGVISAATRIRPILHAGKYHFQVTALHHHLSATATVVIDILLGNTVPKLKPLTVYVNTFYSLVNPMTTLGTIALDRPHNEPITFSFGSSDPDVHHYFDINPASGTIAISSAARHGYYRLTVLATSSSGVGSGIVHVYVHTVSNTTLQNAVIVEFEDDTETHFVSLTIENFAAALTEVIPCARKQVEIIGIQVASSGRLLVAVAVREVGLLSYISQKEILDQLRANEGSPHLDDIVSYGSEVCTGEPCPNFQQCSPVVHMHRCSRERVYKVLQSAERVYISQPFSTSFACHCPPGFELEGLCSVQTDHCAFSPCHFSAPCENLHDDYICKCPPFTGGKNCSFVCPSPSCTPCVPDRCLHGSECIESQDLSSYSCASCLWPAEYSGPNCELTSVHISSSGYVAFPSLGSVVKTTILFRFSTVSPYGTILYAGRVSGKNDMLSVEIVQGQLRVTLSLGDPNERVAMTTRSQRKLNDGEWHDVRIQLDGHLQRLTVVVSHCSSSPTYLAGVSDTCVLQGRVATKKKSLDVNTLLYFGGVESHVPRVSSVAGFHFDGCLADLVINDRIINLADPVRRYGTSEGCAPRDGKCRTGYCLHGECVSVWNGTVCHCEKFPECRQTSSPVSLSNGYIQLLPSEGTVTTVGHFTLAFRTRQTCATLIGFGDVASVQLKEGSLVYIQNTSSLSTSLALHTTVTDGLWHTIKLATANRVTEFSIDSGRAAATHHDTQTFSVTSITLGSRDLASLDHFEGCFADFSINTQHINLAAAVNSTSDPLGFVSESLRAVPGCQSGSQCSDLTTECPEHSTCVNGWHSHSCVCEHGFVAAEGGVCINPCAPNPCRNGGICVPGDPLHCQCSPGYYGPTCALTESPPCHTGLYSPPDCQPCHCDLEGVMEAVCDGSGRCLCNLSLDVFSPPNDVSCQLCDCDMTGATDQHCSPSSGECACRPGVTGRRCDRCEEGYAGMDEDGCKEALVVSGLYTLKTVMYRAEFDRDGSPELRDLIAVLAGELKMTLERFSIIGEQEVTITAITNSSRGVVVHYTVSAYSLYDDHPLPDGHVHTVASVMQAVVQSGWVGLHQVDSTSHFLLTGCSSCDGASRCVVSQTNPQNPQPFTCDTCPDGHTLDGIICRKIVNETCIGVDTDRDGISDLCDNCPYVFNPSQDLNDCSALSGMCPTGHSSGVLWSSVPEVSTATKPCASPDIGYAKRQCLVGGVWGEVDKRDCVSVRAQQFLYDAESLEAQQVMHIHQLLYSLSEVTSFTVSGVGSVSGGDLSAVARYLSEVVSLQVDSAHSPVSGGSHQLLEALASATSSVLAPHYNTLWTPYSGQYTQFPPTRFPHFLEKINTLFRMYHSNGVLKANMEVKTMFNLTNNFTGAVVYVNAVNNTLSSVSIPSDLAKNLTASRHLDFVVGSYPTISPLLSPSPSNLTVVSAVLAVQVWGEGVATDNLPTPVIITLSHTRKVYVYSKESAKCVFWRVSGSAVLQRSSGWSSDGCEVAGVNATHTTCHCRHLSTFAALLPTTSLQPVQDDVSADVFHPTIFTYVALGVTCFLLLLANLALWITRWSAGTIYITVYRNLVLALLLTTIVFLIGIDRTEPPVLCTVFAVALDFLIISSLFWMLVVGVVIARLLLHPPPKRASFIVTFFVMAGLWTIPILMCVIPVGVVAVSSSSFAEDFGYPHYCLVGPGMVSVLLSPIAVLMILIIVALVVVLILIQTQKLEKVPDSHPQMTPGGLAASINRARRRLGILAATLCLYLFSWGAGLLVVYGHVFPGPTHIILEVVFAISYTALGGFLFIVLCLNKKVINSIRVQFESKYQNSSLRAIAGSSSLVSRLRMIGRSQENSLPHPNTHMHRRHQHRRIEDRNNTREQLEATRLDLVSMEAHARIPNAEPQYSQVLPASAHRPAPVTSQHQPRHSRRNHVPQAQLVDSQAAHVLNVTPSTSSYRDAGLDTDVTSDGDQPWYHIPEPDEHTLSPPTDIDYPHTVSDNDDSSRADPSGLSVASIHDLEDDELQASRQRRDREGSEEGIGGGRAGRRGSRDDVNGSFDKLHAQPQLTPERHPNDEQEQHNGWQEEVGVESSDRGLDELRNRFDSPQPSTDPLWYCRASGCEETGSMPTPFNNTQKNTSPHKSVTWADQELDALPPILQSPHHSDASYCSSITSTSLHLDPPSDSSSQQNSHEGSPRHKTAQEFNPRKPGSGLITPPLLSLRSPPEGTGAVVMFPSPHHLRKSSLGSIPPSPASHLSSSSSQHSSVPSATRPPSQSPRGVAVGHSPSKAIRRLSSHDYHGPSAHSSTNRQQGLIRDNPDGSKTLQSLV